MFTGDDGERKNEMVVKKDQIIENAKNRWRKKKERTK